MYKDSKITSLEDWRIVIDMILNDMKLFLVKESYDSSIINETDEDYLSYYLIKREKLIKKYNSKSYLLRFDFIKDEIKINKEDLNVLMQFPEFCYKGIERNIRLSKHSEYNKIAQFDIEKEREELTQHYTKRIKDIKNGVKLSYYNFRIKTLKRSLKQGYSLNDIYFKEKKDYERFNYCVNNAKKLNRRFVSILYGYFKNKGLFEFKNQLKFAEYWNSIGRGHKIKINVKSAGLDPMDWDCTEFEEVENMIKDFNNK